MERILILMQAANWAEATEALTSARENALHRNALSYALVLPEAPTSPEECNMAAFGTLQYLVSPEMTFAAMETLWHGERYALLAHPAMRFERDWEKKLLRALNDCPVENAQAVLTGYLPAQDDPIGAVCPVAAERIDPDGTLCFAHGMPLTLAAHPMPGVFLHPDFFFARAGFIRAMAQGSGTAFLRAMVQGWQCCALNQPVITLTHDLPVPPVRIDPQEDGLAQLKEEYGVDFAAGTLSAAAKRGLKSNSLDMTLAVTPLMRIKSAVQRRRRKRTDPMPLCVTVCPASLDEEGMHWLRQLTQMQDLALLCYAEGLKLREVAEFHPNVLEYKPRYALTMPTGKPPLFSRAAMLSAARDRVLSSTHYIWMAPDCVRYPLYTGMALPWKRLCGEKIVLASVRNRLDLSMVVVPDKQIKPLMSAIGEQLRALLAAGTIPETEEALWAGIVKEHPDWFEFRVLPVENSCSQSCSEEKSCRRLRLGSSRGLCCFRGQRLLLEE